MSTKSEDRVIFRDDLCELLSVSSETVRRWLKEKKLPPPDINLSVKTQGWRLSTLQAFGVGIL